MTKRDMYDMMETWPDTVIVYGFNIRVIAKDPSGYTSVTGFCYTDDETFCLTVFTKQKRNRILKLMQSPTIESRPLLVSGKWRTKSVRGNSGEVYRPLIGNISLL
jgi:hypothetical protein